tara:strand:- start:505 stop:651 length:147 start_codon:yes stop_codon:yes gene_type:complete
VIPDAIELFPIPGPPNRFISLLIYLVRVVMYVNKKGKILLFPLIILVL